MTYQYSSWDFNQRERINVEIGKIFHNQSPWTDEWMPLNLNRRPPDHQSDWTTMAGLEMSTLVLAQGLEVYINKEERKRTMDPICSAITTSSNQSKFIQELTTSYSCRSLWYYDYWENENYMCQLSNDEILRLGSPSTISNIRINDTSSIFFWLRKFFWRSKIWTHFKYTWHPALDLIYPCGAVYPFEFARKLSELDHGAKQQVTWEEILNMWQRWRRRNRFT